MGKINFFGIIYCHYIFLIENVIYNRRIDRSDSSSNFIEYLYKTISLVNGYLRTCLVIKDKKRLFTRFLVNNYCSIPNKNIRFVANYGLDISLIENRGKKNALCFGLHDNCAFEQSLCSVFNINVIACDPTPLSVEIFGRKSNNYCFRFFPFAISNNSGPIDFFMNDDSDRSGGSIKNLEKSNSKIEVQGFTYNDLKEKFKISVVDVLKMDIDGGEIEILLNLLENEKKINFPNQVNLELDIDLDLRKVNETINFLDKMKSFYKIYFIPHKTRYSGLELLFVKK